MAGWMGTLQRQLDSWQRLHTQWSQWPWQLNWKWPWQDRDNDARRLKEECERRKQQIEALCRTVKVETLGDLQDLLGAMVLAECVYKSPDHELVRAVNKFKADFGGQLVSVDRIQASLDHVPHRYLLAEGRDTLFASFIGTNHYKDVIADVNVLQGAVFHDEGLDLIGDEEEVKDNNNEQSFVKGLGTESQLGKSKQQNIGPRPAAHRGFLGRAKGIPAAELYQLAQKKDKKLVLCGHSLGGAVAVLTTLAILRVFSPLASKKLNVKCITFSQPPVGNRALRDYVHRSGWQQHFLTYCIPEDIVPRILSPAYFQHFQEAGLATKVVELQESAKKPDGSERMALGLGPVQTSFWRLSRLVPLVAGQNPIQWLKRRKPDEATGPASATDTKVQDSSYVEQLEIEENTGGVSLVPLPSADEVQPSEDKPAVTRQSDWRRRLTLPSYIPFGQLFLLEKTAVKPLSASEYTRLTSVQSVLMELRDRFQSHTMKSYRSRFQKIYEGCLGPEAPSPVFLMEHLPHIPHLRRWLGVNGSGVAELSEIATPLSIRTAASLVPLGWTGSPGEKGCEPLRVEIQGYGLHLCTLVRAQVNGRWCSTRIESSPVPPSPSPLLTPEDQKHIQPDLQKLRIVIGAPLPVSAQASIQAELPEDCFVGTDFNDIQVEGLGQVAIHCSSDFKTSAKCVSMRLRRVRLLGLEGAGKTSLYYALMGQGRVPALTGDGIFPDMEWREGISYGVNYVDAAGVNLQDLALEVEQLRQELNNSNPKKLDMIILVHNLAHKIPRSRQQSGRPALAPLLDEVAAAGIPVTLALTNKFAVSADRRQHASVAVMQAYKINPESTVVVNSCPYTVRGNTEASLLGLNSNAAKEPGAAKKFMSAPISLVQMPFRRKDEVLPVEGVKALRGLIHSVLLSREKTALEEMGRAALEMREESSTSSKMDKNVVAFLARSSGGVAGVGAAVGAGVGVLVAIVSGAAATLKKP